MAATNGEELSMTIMDELRGDPRLDASRITASCAGGHVVLRGAVRSLSEKCRAERIVRELAGVLSVTNEIEVRLTVGNYRTDEGLMHLTNEMLENHAMFPLEPPTATVRSGWVTLHGNVVSEIHKACAEEVVREIAGVRGITNEIAVVPAAPARGAKPSFEAALRRRPFIATDDLQVTVAGATMTLRGTVRSCVDHDDLLVLAARTRGIARVNDRLTVRAR